MPQLGSSNAPVKNDIIGFIFTFNLIVGTGALALPKVFALTGWLLGSLTIILIAFFSYLCASLTIETIYLTGNLLKDGSIVNQNENTPLLDYNPTDKFLQRKFEIGELASIYFGKIGKILFYLCLVVYLFGDLTIYSVAISQTLNDVICKSGDECDMHFIKIKKLTFYHGSLIFFFLLIFPFTCYQINKTKILQILSTIARWNAFILMITLSSVKIYDNHHNHHNFFHPNLPTSFLDSLVNSKNSSFNNLQNSSTNNNDTTYVNIWNYRMTPALFGVAVYSFMCHHSIPSLLLIMPIKPKIIAHSKSFINRVLMWLRSLTDRITGVTNNPRISNSPEPSKLTYKTPFSIFAWTYIIVTVFYLLLCVLASFAFPFSTSSNTDNINKTHSNQTITNSPIKDLYTLNFVNSKDTHITPFRKVLGYFLAIFPIFPLTTNFPILAITLRNNIYSLLYPTVNDNSLSNNSNSNNSSPTTVLNESRSNFISNNSESLSDNTALLNQSNNTSLQTIKLKKALVLALTLGPPFLIAWFTPSNLSLLVTLTGAYPGLIIQCLIPVLLVYRARQKTMYSENNLESNSLGSSILPNNSNANSCFKSYFQSPVWLWTTLAWVAVCTILVTMHVVNLK